MPIPTLIHLVSDQTLQNVLPILALQPRRVIQILSQETPRFLRPAANTYHAVAEAGRSGFVMPEEWPEPVPVGADSPSIEQTQVAVAEVLRANPGAWVNYTGGTKNMSIGAWLAAREAGAPLLYCDTPRSFLSDVAGGPVPQTTLSEVAQKLTVPVILASQGLRQGEHWARKGLPPQQQALGEICFRLVQQHGNAFREFRHKLQLHGLPKGGGKATAKDVTRVMQEAVPGGGRPEFHEFMASAEASGLLEKRKAGWFYKLKSHASPQDQKAKVHRIAQALSGAAFEAYVGGLLKGSRRFTNFLTNVYPAGMHPESQGFGESDFLAYEPERLALTLISCKASPPGLEHLESLLARKGKFGGLFAQTLLCVEYGVDVQREQVLRAQCASLGIGCAIGDEIAGVLRCE